MSSRRYTACRHGARRERNGSVRNSSRLSDTVIVTFRFVRNVDRHVLGNQIEILAFEFSSFVSNLRDVHATVYSTFRQLQACAEQIHPRHSLGATPLHSFRPRPQAAPVELIGRAARFADDLMHSRIRAPRRMHEEGHNQASQEQPWTWRILRNHRNLRGPFK